MAKAVTTILEKRELVTKSGLPGIESIPPVGGVAIYEDMEEDGDNSNEGAAGNRRLPIFRKLDPKSPQRKPVERGGTPGAKDGDIFNTVTGQVYDGKRGLYMIPCHLTRKFVCYVRREDDGGGGGFVSVHEPEEPLIIRRLKEATEKYGDTFRKIENGENAEGKPLDLVETFYIGCILVVPNEDGSFPGEYGDIFPGLIPFSSTDIKAYNGFYNLNDAMRYPMKDSKTGMIKPTKPKLFSHVWHLSTFFFERGKQSWYKWAVRRAVTNDDGTEAHYSLSRLDVRHPLYVEAAHLRQALREGNAEIDYSKDTGEDRPAEGGGQPLAQDDDKSVGTLDDPTY